MVFATDVDEALADAHGIAGDQDTLDQLMRIVFEDLTVLERSRLRLVAVDREVLRLVIALGHEAPLQTRWEAGAAATAETRAFYGVDDLIGRQAQCLLVLLIAAVGHIHVDLVQVLDLGKDEVRCGIHSVVLSCEIPRANIPRSVRSQRGGGC